MKLFIPIISLVVASTSAIEADEPSFGRDAIVAYAQAWKANRELLPPLQAELKVVNRNYDVTVSVEKTTKLDNGLELVSRRDPESTNLYRVYRDAQRMRVTAVTPADELELLRDLLVIGPDWKTVRGNLLILRRRDQIGGMPSVDPYDMQSPEFQLDSPDELAHATQGAWVKEVRYQKVDDDHGRLEIVMKFESETARHVIDYDLSAGMVPIRYRHYINDRISSDQSLEYQTVGKNGGKICVKRFWRMRPEGQDSLADEPKSWYTELTYELTKLREMTAEEMKVAFSEEDFQADQISDLRSLEP